MCIHIYIYIYMMCICMYHVLFVFCSAHFELRELACYTSCSRPGAQQAVNVRSGTSHIPWMG